MWYQIQGYMKEAMQFFAVIQAVMNEDISAAAKQGYALQIRCKYESM